MYNKTTGKMRKIVDSTAFKAYEKVLTFAWTTASAAIGKKVAQKLGCGSTGQKVGAITGAVVYCVLDAKAEKLGKELGITNEAWADLMDATIQGYSDEPDADEIWDEFIDSVSDLDHPKDAEAHEA